MEDDKRMIEEWLVLFLELDALTLPILILSVASIGLLSTCPDLWLQANSSRTLFYTEKADSNRSMKE